MLVYSLLLAVGLLVSAPWWLLRMATTARYREGLQQRLGAVPRALQSYVAGRRVVWVHAVSVGETLAATRLVSELEAALGDGWRVVISTTTRTGQALARERFGAERVFYMPLDFAWTVRAYLNALEPAALVLMESELWPRLLHEAQRRGIPRIVANARVSDRSYRRALKVRWLWKHVLAKVSVFLAQSEEDARRLQELGAANAKAAGNLKYDVRPPKNSALADRILALAHGRRILVAGSTLGENPSEDVTMVEAINSFPVDDRPLLVLAPRHPENFEAAYNIAKHQPVLRATEIKGGSFDDNTQIVVLDTIGDLAALYAVADLAFVGGSLVKRGGHNPLEPAQFGVPVLMGPSFENFRGVVNAMQEANAIRIVPTDIEVRQISPKDVPSALSHAAITMIREMLSRPDETRAMGERGRAVFESQQGATARAVAEIVKAVQA
ncbi:3-deoxy-D-manno-octulosonic acid transferase [Granulicella cerasi]|uniref:3-deoxy-D-manno-octulosonic acid transferase n=1 Tax=Granulicella cerasi TaxID=741063 RepID=A0ABW1ZC36_9BACT|nr:glycosyltransferase N-terminal domain-containing protein [Granulicella cerasi]